MNPKIYSNINNYLIIYTPNVIPWGQMDKQTNKQMDGRTDRQTDRQIFTQYSGISSHSLRGVRITKSAPIIYIFFASIYNNGTFMKIMLANHFKSLGHVIIC